MSLLCVYWFTMILHVYVLSAHALVPKSHIVKHGKPHELASCSNEQLP
uniref:Uncharacterized protein n=1 Tax=Anguilla anguilla TaxID=7936 RepID=A0A0E9QBH0_ANGAN